MNRNKTPGRTYTILKRVILITALLAFIEVIVLVVIHYKNSNKATAKKPEQAKEMPTAAASDTPKAAPVVQPKGIAENKPKDTITKKDTVQIITPAAEKPVTEKPVVAKAPAERKILRDTTALPPAKPKEIKVAKKVSSEQMFEILNEVRMEKLKVNNTAKCISIQIVNSANEENGSMIANYLRKNGYIISGREVIQGSQKGIEVNAEGPCVKLTIGTL